MPLPGWSAKGLGIIENTSPSRFGHACAASLNSIRWSRRWPAPRRGGSSARTGRARPRGRSAAPSPHWFPRATQGVQEAEPARQDLQVVGLGLSSASKASAATARAVTAQQEELGLDAQLQRQAAFGQPYGSGAAPGAGRRRKAGRRRSRRPPARHARHPGQGLQRAQVATGVELAARPGARQAGGRRWTGREAAPLSSTACSGAAARTCLWPRPVASVNCTSRGVDAGCRQSGGGVRHQNDHHRRAEQLVGLQKPVGTRPFWPLNTGWLAPS